MSNISFNNPDSAKVDLNKADRDTQLKTMRQWFFNHYEDPVENCPHETAEGGYMYLWGGPYDAEEVLREEFEDVVPQDAIDTLVQELREECFEWSAKPTDDDYDHYAADIAIITGGQLAQCERRLREAERLVAQKLQPELQQTLQQMVFVQVITILETFLSDTFIHKVVPDATLLRKLVESENSFKMQQVPVSSVFAVREGIGERVKVYLTGIVWHNLTKVSKLYKRVLNVQFSELDKIVEAIDLRHDCVHRNGKTKDGEPVNVTKDTVFELIKEVLSLVQAIDTQLTK